MAEIANVGVPHGGAQEAVGPAPTALVPQDTLGAEETPASVETILDDSSQSGEDNNLLKPTSPALPSPTEQDPLQDTQGIAPLSSAPAELRALTTPLPGEGEPTPMEHIGPLLLGPPTIPSGPSTPPRALPRLLIEMLATTCGTCLGVWMQRCLVLP